MRLSKPDIVHIAIVALILLAAIFAIPAIASGQNAQLPETHNQTTQQPAQANCE